MDKIQTGIILKNENNIKYYNRAAANIFHQESCIETTFDQLGSDITIVYNFHYI